MIDQPPVKLKMHILYVLVSIFQERECALTLVTEDSLIKESFPKTRIGLMETLTSNKDSDSRGAWGMPLLPLGLKGQKRSHGHQIHRTQGLAALGREGKASNAWKPEDSGRPGRGAKSVNTLISLPLFPPLLLALAAGQIQLEARGKGNSLMQS